jgi:hypothetical protein
LSDRNRKWELPVDDEHKRFYAASKKVHYNEYGYTHVCIPDVRAETESAEAHYTFFHSLHRLASRHSQSISAKENGVH